MFLHSVAARGCQNKCWVLVSCGLWPAFRAFVAAVLTTTMYIFASYVLLYTVSICVVVYIYISLNRLHKAMCRFSILDPRFLRFCIFSAEPLSSQPFHFLSVARTSMSSPHLPVGHKRRNLVSPHCRLYIRYLYIHTHTCMHVGIFPCIYWPFELRPKSIACEVFSSPNVVPMPAETL